MLLVFMGLLDMVGPDVPPPPVDEDFGDGWMPNSASNEQEKNKLEKIRKTNEEVFIIVNSVMVCLN